MSVHINTSQNVALDYETASIGDRILANLIDYVIYIVWMMFMVVVMGGFGKVKGDMGTFYMIAFMLIPVMLYPVLTEYFLNGQTLGKRALNIRVVRLDGSKPTLGAYLIRWVFVIVDSLFSHLVGIITIAINGKGQRLGDLAAGTTVIKTQKTISLDQLTSLQQQEDYKIVYPEVSQLNDKDIETIKQVLNKDNDYLTDTAAQKIQDLLGITYSTNSTVFLKTIVKDYTFFALKDE